MNKIMKIEKWLLIVLLGVLIIAMTPSQLYSSRYSDGDFPYEGSEWNRIQSWLILGKMILASVNSILLIILLAIYVGIYRKTGSRFSVGLIVFSIALLLFSVTSNPLIFRLAGFYLSGLGPFTILPDLFTCVASAILLYLSRE